MDYESPESIDFFPYELFFSKRNYGKRQGALLRCHFSEGVGYSDCHPWVEFGDEPLFEQLQSLRKKNPLPLISKSLVAAQFQCQPLFKYLYTELSELTNHYLLLPGESYSVIPEAFQHVKVKAVDLRNISFEFLESLPYDFKLDANGLWNFEEIKELDWSQFSSLLYIEDPFSSVKEWGNFLDTHPSVSLACDFFSGACFEAYAQVLIYKPARSKPSCVKKFLSKSPEKKVSVTSSLGHPLGQINDAVEAVLVQKEFPKSIISSGLQSHHVYKPSHFHELIGDLGPHMNPAPWSDFVDYLEKVPWKKL